MRRARGSRSGRQAFRNRRTWPLAGEDIVGIWPQTGLSAVMAAAASSSVPMVVDRKTQQRKCLCLTSGAAAWKRFQ